MNKNLKLAIPILFVVFLFLIIAKSLFFNSTSANVDSQISIQNPIKKMDINKTFNFPLKDSTGSEAGKFAYTIESAELKNEIIARGTKATAVKGRAFLIINLKLQNNENQNIQINTRDYLRLTINKNEKELLGADLHNDPVEVQAISTKYTRVGFGINENDKDMVLLVGEINGQKEKIPLNLK